MAHYLNNFIRVIPPDIVESLKQINYEYQGLTNALNIPRNEEKDCHGTTVEVLGIKLNTINLGLSLERFNSSRSRDSSRFSLFLRLSGSFRPSVYELPIGIYCIVPSDTGKTQNSLLPSSGSTLVVHCVTSV